MSSPISEKTKHFNPGVTVDVVIFTAGIDALEILLIDRLDEPWKDFPALPGGFVRKGETTREAAVRVLKDKAGVKNVYIEQLFTFDEIDRDPRGQILSVTYFALVPSGAVTIEAGPLTEKPRFISIKKMPRLAFDHRKIVDYSIKRLVDKIRYTNIIYSLLPKEFTLTDLQKTFEIILNRRIDKRNFRKKFAELKLIRSTGKKRRGLRQRPALLYQFTKTDMKELDKFL